jgi:tight adherence protein B
VAKRVKPVLLGQSRRSRDVHDLVRQEGNVGFFEAAASLIPGLRGLEALLAQSRLDWSPGTFLILALGLSLGLGFSVFLLTGAFLWGTLFAVTGALLPYLFASRRRKRWLNQFEKEFPETIDLLTRSIRAGHPLSSSIGMVGDEGPPAVSSEFRRVFEEQRFGIPFEEALLGMVDRTDLMDVRIFVIAVLVQRDVGGNLAETLENLAQTIRRRFYLRRQLRVFTAQGRMTGYALAALPVVVGFGIHLLTPEYTAILFTHPVGLIMVGTAVFFQLMGVLWIRKIINIDI